MKDVFEHTYTNAHIDLLSTTEAEAVALFSRGEVPLICISRHLTAEELKDIKERGYYIKTIPFAADAIAFIGNAAFDSTFTEKELISILTTGVPDNNYKGLINIVFDKNNTGTATYLRDSVLNGQKFGENCYALNSVNEVYDYVRKHVDAIGVLGVNHISDTEDEQVKKSLQGLRIVAVSKNEDPDNFVKPGSFNISSGAYPFLRNLYLINGEGYNGLATGFAAFIVSDIGMTIIKQIGLKPAKEPVRVIEIRKTFEE
jgi:phosphate transport system substrate-binding protein